MYILSQAGVLLLAVFILVIRFKKEPLSARKYTFIMMTAVIAIFVAAFVIECIMLIKYRVNIDLSLKYTLLSRAVYCSGFVGTAIGFLLPAPTIDDEEYKEKQGDFISSENDEDDVDLVI